MDINYLPLLVVFIIAWSIPILLSWMGISKVPAIVIEIAMGVIVGPFVLGWVSGGEPYLEFLSYTGFLFLIFLSGLALDVEAIVSSFPRGGIKKIDIVSNTFLLSVVTYLASVALAALLVHFLPFFESIDPIFMTILLPSVALSMVVPVIKGDAEINNKFGQIMLLEGAVSTIVTILLIAVYAGVYKRNGFEIELLFFLIIFIFFFIAYRVGKLLMKIQLFRTLLYQLEHASSQIKIRGSIALLLLFVMVAVEINTEPVLGAFFAGILLSIFLTKERSALLFKLEGMGYGFFIPIFFIMVGIRLDIASLNQFTTSLNFILILTASFYVIQVIPTVFLFRLFGIRKSLSSGMLLTSRLGLTIATAQIGLGLGLISTATNAGIVAASIITCIVSPTLYKFLNNKVEHYRNVYIVGGGITGAELAARLKMHAISYLIITSQKKQHRDLKLKGIDVLHADEESIDTYRRSVKIRTLDNIVVLTGSTEKNLRIAHMLNKRLGHSNVMTVTNEPGERHTYEEDIITKVRAIDIHQIIASHLENEITRPTVAHALMDSFGAYNVEEVLVGNNSQVDQKYIKDVAFPRSGSLMVIRRNDEMFIPHGDTQLLSGDLITVIGNTSALRRFRELLL